MSEQEKFQSWTIKEVNFDKDDNSLFNMVCTLDEDESCVSTFSEDEWYYSNMNKSGEDHSLPKVGDKLVFALLSDKEIEEETILYNLEQN